VHASNTNFNAVGDRDQVEYCLERIHSVYAADNSFKWMLTRNIKIAVSISRGTLLKEKQVNPQKDAPAFPTPRFPDTAIQ
jgi:hypothetical protein